MRQSAWGVVGVVVLLAACRPPEDPAPLLLDVRPASLSLQVGETATLGANANRGGVREPLNELTWSSSDPTVAVVLSNDTGGNAVLRANRTGTATITARLGSETATSTATVTAPPAPTIKGVKLKAVAPTPMGVRVYLRLTATWSDGTTSDVSSSALWTSSDASIVHVVGGGVATGISVGSARVMATFQGESDSVNVTFVDAVPFSLVLTPFSQTCAFEGTATLLAVATLSDGTRVDVTAPATWVISGGGNVSVPDDAGRVSCVRSGAVNITAQYAGLSATAYVTVANPPTPTRIDVTLDESTCPVGRGNWATAVAHYADGSSENVTATASWALSALGVVGPPYSDGYFSCIGRGVVDVIARYRGASGRATVTVGPAVVVALYVGDSPWSPGEPIEYVTVGGSLQLYARSLNSNGDESNVTNQATWTVDGGVLEVSQTGLVTGLDAGSGLVTAEFGGRSDSQFIVVSP